MAAPDPFQKMQGRLISEAAGRPLVLSEEIPYDKPHSCNEQELSRPLGGFLWWNSLYWNNFPPLSIYDQKVWEEHKGVEFYSIMAMINGDKKLSEQYVTFQMAREDLCISRPMPKSRYQISAECMQYEGQKEQKWHFPFQGQVPFRDNHMPMDLQARRFYDNGVLHMGINAMEFSDKLMPVSSLDACITIADHVANPTWGYYPLLMRIGGWPYRVKKIGSFEGYGEGGHQEMTFGIHYFNDEPLWDLLEGPPALAPTGPSGEMELQGNAKVGSKFWAQLYELDGLGTKNNQKKHYDPAVAPEKGYVWFTVVDTITVPSTGQKGVKIQISDEGIVPAWLDLNFLQAFVGDFPLGFLNGGEAEGVEGTVTVARTFESRKVVVENANSKIVFDEPCSAQTSDFCDMGWAIFDCLFKGASMKFGPTQGKFEMDVGEDEGAIAYKASGPAPLVHMAWGRDEYHFIQVPRSSYPYERRLVM
jgi:hypothetical protein